MNDNNLEEQKKQVEQNEASQKTAHVVGKAAATYFGGGAGAKIYDLASKTKVGKDIENKLGKSLQKQPGMNKAMEGLNKSGALDAADKGMDLASGGSPTEGGSGLENLSNTPIAKSGINNNEKENTTTNSSSGKEEENSSENNSNDSFSLFGFSNNKGKKIAMISVAISAGATLLIILFAAGSLLYPLQVAKEFVKGLWNKIVDIFTKDQQELEEEFYQELKDTQKEFNKNYQICIDTNLITASLLVNQTFDQFIEEGQENDPNGEDVTDSDGNKETIPYKKMKKQVRLLARMQLINKHYELDKTSDSYCSTSSKILPITEGNHNSSTFELIASHDMDGIKAAFTSKVNEEQNNAYYTYYPPFNSDGTCSKRYAEDMLPKDGVELSIGSIDNMKESVFYWNLVNSFIPSYYEEFLPDESDSTYSKKVDKLAEDIYLLYKQIGPGETCSVSTSYICRNDEGADFYGGTREKFIENTSPIAINEMTRTGVFSSITLAQAVLESSGGSSGLSSKYANYYGMTAGGCAPSNSPSTLSGTVYMSGEGGNSCTGNQFWNGSVVAMCNASGGDCQWYRIYDSFQNSTRDHSRLLSEGYNCNIYSSYQEQLDCIVNHGYATDPNYKDKIISVINNYNLADYDIGTWDGTIVPVSGNQFSDSLCYSNATMVAGAFTSWKQYNSTWSNVKLGTSTVGRIGCAMTSVCIQIMRSGVSTSLGEEFNPGTFAQKMTSIGGFDSRGNIFWAKAGDIAPNFQFVNSVSKKATPSDLARLVNQGYYIILNVKNGRHWVAVDRVDGNKIYMFDPGSPGTEVGETYGLDSIVGYVYYRRG